jgi:hypothetical protein
MGPKDTFQFHGDGVLNMCCFDARFRFYADVTSKIRQIGNAVPFTRKVSEEKISLSKKDRVMKLIRPHIKKIQMRNFIREYILESPLNFDCNTPPTYLINI